MLPAIDTNVLTAAKPNTVSNAPEGLGSPSGAATPYTPQTKSQFIAWLRGRQDSAKLFAEAIVHGCFEYSFWKRALEFAATTKSIMTIQPVEIMSIIDEYDTDAGRLAALEQLAQPRFAYEWTQAGGPRWRQYFPGVTEDDFAKARSYYHARFLNRAPVFSRSAL